jgi:hypothetical protein
MAQRRKPDLLASMRRSERSRQAARDRVTAAIRVIAAGPPPMTLPDPTIKETPA